MPGVAGELVGFGAIIAFVVLAGLVRGPAHQPVWFYIFFAVFGVGGAVALALSRIIDMRTRRVHKIDQVDITYGPREAGPGKGLTITLLDGRRIECGEKDDVVGVVAQQLRSAIEKSREVVHPLLDEAVR